MTVSRFVLEPEHICGRLHGREQCIENKGADLEMESSEELCDPGLDCQNFILLF